MVTLTLVLLCVGSCLLVSATDNTHINNGSSKNVCVTTEHITLPRQGSIFGIGYGNPAVPPDDPVNKTSQGLRPQLIAAHNSGEAACF